MNGGRGYYRRGGGGGGGRGRGAGRGRGGGRRTSDTFYRWKY